MVRGVSQHEREYSFPAEVRVAKQQSMQQLALGCAVGGSLCVIPPCMCVLIHFCMGRRTDEYVLFYHQLRRGILLLLRMESLRSEYKHALAVALSEFDGGFDGIR